MKSSPVLRLIVGVFALACSVHSLAQSDIPADFSRSKWHNLVEWTHSWDMVDAVTYIPDDAEQAAWKIDASPRVAKVRDRGSKSMPLLRDQGPWGGMLKVPALPGPLYLPSDARFSGRPSFFADPCLAGPDLFNLHSLLSPVIDPMDPGTFFAAPKGYAPPYWTAILAHPPVGEVSIDGNPSLSAVMDSHRGAFGAGPTIGGNLSGKTWGVACFGPQPPSFFWSGIDRPYRAQTVLVVVFIGAGIDGSWMELNWREDGKIKTHRETITQGRVPDGAPFPFEETFFGWAETMRNSAMGIKLGEPTTSEIDTLRAWATPFIPQM